MKSRTTAGFRKLYGDLPEQIRHQAKNAYRKFEEDPRHPSLQFKQVHPSRAIFWRGLTTITEL